MNFFVVFLVAIVMEPITTVTHRIVMHGFGWGWHRSHHDRVAQRLEKNDYYPIVFSVISIALFAYGTNHKMATSIATGITIYGIAYFFVHEVIIHSRFGKLPFNNRLFRFWTFSHNVHHQFQGAPYGFLAPVTPMNLKKKALDNPRDLVDRFPRKSKHQN